MLNETAAQRDSALLQAARFEAQPNPEATSSQKKPEHTYCVFGIPGFRIVFG